MELRFDDINVACSAPGGGASRLEDSVQGRLVFGSGFQVVGGRASCKGACIGIVTVCLGVPLDR